MKARTKLLLFLAALVVGSTAGEERAIDFSGAWKMDPARSESAHQAVPIGAVTLIIKQTPGDISIETRRAEPNKTAARSEILTYKLDGSETTSAATDGSPIKCRAHWDGPKLITGTTRNIQGATVTTLYGHSLDSSGRELTVYKTLTVEHGYQFEGAKSYGTGTDVFIRAKAAPSK